MNKTIMDCSKDFKINGQQYNILFEPADKHFDIIVEGDEGQKWRGHFEFEKLLNENSKYNLFVDHKDLCSNLQKLFLQSPEKIKLIKEREGMLFSFIKQNMIKSTEFKLQLKEVKEEKPENKDDLEILKVKDAMKSDMT
jgi:hypothetical protein